MARTISHTGLRQARIFGAELRPITLEQFRQTGIEMSQANCASEADQAKFQRAWGAQWNDKFPTAQMPAIRK